MTYRYQTQGTCSRLIDIELTDAGIISDVRFEGGCDGNLKGMSKLVKGRSAQEMISLLEGISCADNPTSCPDQLARALKTILEHQKA